MDRTGDGIRRYRCPYCNKWVGLVQGHLAVHKNQEQQKCIGSSLLWKVEA